MWLFIASEVMLFGGLFSAYALLRAGAASWPGRPLSPVWFVLVTLNLILAALPVWGHSLGTEEPTQSRGRLLFAAGIAFGATFLLRVGGAYSTHLSAGHFPSTNTFWALFYLLTSVHALHVIAGLAVMVYLAGPGWSPTAAFARRVQALRLYWTFVLLVWLCIAAFYVT